MGRTEIIRGRAGRLWPVITTGIAESRKNGRPCILLVPEQYTLQAEKDLIAGLQLNGLLDIDVLSPQRLQQRVQEYAGSSGKRALNERGRGLAMTRALIEQEKNLTYYGGAARLTGTARELCVTLAELQEAGLTPEDLKQTAEETDKTGEKAKIADLQCLWEAYDRIILPGFDDECARQRELLARLERSGVLQGHDLWVYGFDTIRNSLCDLLARVATIAENTRVTLICDTDKAPDGRMFAAQRKSLKQLEKLLSEAGVPFEEKEAPEAGEERDPALCFLERTLFADAARETWTGRTEAVSFYSAANPSAEANETVRTLLAWHAQGIPWERMAVALPRMGELGDILQAALSVSGIPTCISRREPAARHGLCRMLLNALRAATGNYRKEDVTGFFRSGFTTLDTDEALLIEDYVLAHGIDRGKWLKPFTLGDNAEEAERIRRKIMEPLETLHADLRQATQATQSVEAVVRFLQAEGAYNRLLEREKQLLDRGMTAEAAANRQVWKQLMDLLDQLWTILGNRRAAMKDIATIIAGGLEQAETASLPPDTDCVMIGEAGHMLPGRLDALICMGMQDSIMNAGMSGVLTERERKTLEEKKKRSIGISADLKAGLRRSDFYRTFALPARYLKMTWSLAGEDGSPMMPASVVNDARAAFPDCTVEGSTAGDGEGIPCSPEAAMEGLTVRMREVMTGKTGDLPEEWKGALRCLWADPYWREKLTRALETLRTERPAEQIDRETALKLFLTRSVSISKLETYARCPYMHFIRYGLEPAERETFEFRRNDRGTFWHDALDRYLKVAEKTDRWPDLDVTETNTIMDGVLNELTEAWKDGPLTADGCGEWDGKDTLREVKGAAWILTLFAANSDFRTVSTEAKFGGEGGLPPLILHPEGSADVALDGIIDRIDRYDGPDGSYIRVIDNKSSKRTLDPAKMRSGEQLQLMLYLKAALSGMRGTKPAGALYFPISDPDVKDPDSTEAEWAKEAQMKGVTVDIPDVLNAMDRNQKGFSIGNALNKDGTVSQRASWAVPLEVLEGLMDAAEKKAGSLCSEIRSGKIAVSPLGTEGNLPCANCSYRGICRVTPACRRAPEENISFGEVASDGKISYNESR